MFNKEGDEKELESKQRQLLSGSIDHIGKDLQDIKKIGVEHAILDFNRSSISNNIDNIIDISKRLSGFIR